MDFASLSRYSELPATQLPHAVSQSSFSFARDRDSDQLGLDRDVAVRRPGIRTHVVRGIHQTSRDVRLDAWQADIETHSDVVGVAVRAEVDLGVDRQIGR